MTTTTGAGALAMYRRTRRRRRLRIFWSVALLAAAIIAVMVAATATTASNATPAFRRLPILVAALLAAGGLACGVSVSVGPLRDPDRWRRGALGEQETACLLDALPPRRWAVWNDLRVPGSRANIDHVVVGRTGVWVVDSKATRSPIRAGWGSVRFGDRRLDTGPTRWEADMLARQLELRLGPEADLSPSVRPIVAVHGSGLRSRGKRVGGVRVVPAEELLERLTRGRRRLGRRERGPVMEAMADAFGPPTSKRPRGDRRTGRWTGRRTSRPVGADLDGAGTVIG